MHPLVLYNIAVAYQFKRSSFYLSPVSFLSHYFFNVNFPNFSRSHDFFLFICFLLFQFIPCRSGLVTINFPPIIDQRIHRLTPGMC